MRGLLHNNCGICGCFEMRQRGVSGSLRMETPADPGELDVSSGCGLLRRGCLGLQAAGAGQNCACLFALSPSVFVWPLSASWPQLFANGYWSWDVLKEGLHCSQGGRLRVQPVWTLHPYGQAASGTLRLLAPESHRGVEGLISTELESNQPQTKHPAKRILMMVRSASCSISLLWSQRP